MPREGQKVITIPKSTWDKLNEYYEAHKEEYEKKGNKVSDKIDYPINKL